MKEFASFHIYSEKLAPYYEGRQHCIPQDAFDKIAEMGKVEVPNNNYSVQFEVGSEAFEEVVEMLQGFGAVLKDAEKPYDGATICVGREIQFSDEDIASAKYLRLAPKKGIIDVDPDAWREGRYVSQGKGKPSFKLGFVNIGHAPPAASAAFLEKLKGQGFSGIQEHQIVTDKGDDSGFCVLKSDVEAPLTCGGYLTENYQWVATLEEVGTRCMPGSKLSRDPLIYPDGALDGLNANWVQTQEKFGRTADKSPWILVDPRVHQFLQKSKVNMEAYPVLEESQYRSCVSGRMDEILV